MFNKTPVAAALMGLALTAAPVLAAPAFAAEANSVMVDYKDLDLTSAQGQRALERRLDTAARKACGYGTVSTGTHIISQEARSCYKQTRARASDVMAAAIDNASNSRLGG